MTDDPIENTARRAGDWETEDSGVQASQVGDKFMLVEEGSDEAWIQTKDEVPLEEMR